MKTNIPEIYKTNPSARAIINSKVKKAVEDKSEWRAEELRHMLDNFSPDIKDYGADQNVSK